MCNLKIHKTTETKNSGVKIPRGRANEKKDDGVSRIKVPSQLQPGAQGPKVRSNTMGWSGVASTNAQRQSVYTWTKSPHGVCTVAIPCITDSQMSRSSALILIRRNQWNLHCPESLITARTKWNCPQCRVEFYSQWAVREM